MTKETSRRSPQIDSKIKQLQTELQNKTQRFDNKRLDPRDDYGEQQKEIKKLVQQFDPLENASSVRFRSDILASDRHPSLFETIPANCVTNVLKTLQTTTRNNLKYSDLNSTIDNLPLPQTNESNLIDFN